MYQSEGMGPPTPQDYKLPPNVRATTSATEAIHGAQYAVHAVPVQSSRAFLVGIKDLLPPDVPIICVSKGLEVGSGQQGSLNKGWSGYR
jgi:glycerol-3-phosphate dehydrogenase (NAD+)